MAKKPGYLSWDVEEYKEHLTSEIDGLSLSKEAGLEDRFPGLLRGKTVHVGNQHPAMIVNMYGRILVWILPEILPLHHRVCILNLSILHHSLKNFRLQLRLQTNNCKKTFANHISLSRTTGRGDSNGGTTRIPQSAKHTQGSGICLQHGTATVTR